MPSTTTTATCPACSAPASGRYCSSCGALVSNARCAACQSALTPGAKFCHACGTAVGSSPERRESGGLSTALPWTVAAIALVALIALVAAQRFNARTASTLDAPLNALPQAGIDDRGIGAPARAPDISAMSPRERADRLFDRIMLLDAQGKQDSVRFFAQMGIEAYRLLPDIDHDARYDMGRIAAVAGAYDIAAAQVDTILRQYPMHLLALSLGADVARRSGSEQQARDMERRFLAALDTERTKSLPEYQRHQNDIQREAARLKGKG
ncbi:MAG TPA: zinc ribbon domain-containing protein [Gemmatimonadaceae bacterium]|nr:zinc ribbon domain-containing protein [Gemmatimonadaceae bacterium]